MKELKGVKKGFTAVAEKVLGCAIEVHKELGPDLLESTYSQCLAHEFQISKIGFKRNIPYLLNIKDFN